MKGRQVTVSSTGVEDKEPFRYLPNDIYVQIQVLVVQLK